MSIKGNKESFEKYIKKLNLLTINKKKIVNTSGINISELINDEIEFDEIEIDDDNYLIDDFKWIKKKDFLSKYYNIKNPSTSPIINKLNKKNKYLKPAVCLLEEYSSDNDSNYKKILNKKKELHYEYIFSKYYNNRKKVDGTSISNYMTICEFVLNNYKNHDSINCKYKNKCFLCDYINKKRILNIKNEVYLNKFLYTKDEILSKIKIII